MKLRKTATFRLVEFLRTNISAITYEYEYRYTALHEPRQSKLSADQLVELAWFWRQRCCLPVPKCYCRVHCGSRLVEAYIPVQPAGLSQRKNGQRSTRHSSTRCDDLCHSCTPTEKHDNFCTRLSIGIRVQARHTPRNVGTAIHKLIAIYEHT